MLQQQVHFLTTTLMILDALAVIAAGYGAFIVRWYESGGSWTMDTEAFTGSILLVMFASNYMLGKFGLYDDRRPPSYGALLWAVVKVMMVSFSALAVGIFLFQEKAYSRLFFGAFPQRGRVLTNAWAMKIYNFWDALTRQRTDLPGPVPTRRAGRWPR